MSVVINGSAGVTTNSGAVYNGIASGTAVASTSGTSITFSSIPSWVKRVTVMFNGVSTSGTSYVTTRIGTGGTVLSSGYSGENFTSASTVVANNAISTGFNFTDSGSASDVRWGTIVLTLVGSNAWIATGTMGFTGTVRMSTLGGGVTLGGALDTITITTQGGTDTFDAGSINILYE